MAQYDALIRFYYHMDPDTLEDDDWVKYGSEILFNLRFNGTLQPKKEEKPNNQNPPQPMLSNFDKQQQQMKTMNK